MRSILHLDVVPSSIPGAGRGLFSLVPRSKGDHLVEYLGELISAQDVERRYPKGDVGIYCLSLSASLFIDSALSRGVGASANAARRNTKPNARFVADSRSGTARLEATRRIRADEEILLSYGRDYWQGARSSTHSTVGVPEWEWDLSDPFSPSASILSPSSTPTTIEDPSFEFISGPFVANLKEYVSGPFVSVSRWLPDEYIEPTFGPARVCLVEEEVPPPSVCEVSVGPRAVKCTECIEGIFVCPSHLIQCGGIPHTCCKFCLRVCCFKHIYCPCFRVA